MKDDKLYLLHIADAIRDIEKYLHGLDYDKFVKNSLVIDAVVRKKVF